MKWNKNTFQSKTFWGALASIGYGIVNLLDDNGQKDVAIMSIITGVQTLFLRDAVAKLEGKNGN